MATIVVRPHEGRLLVFFPYSPELVAKIKTVPGRLWHKAEKRWSVPDDLDWSKNQLIVRSGKGGKDRCTTLPTGLQTPLRQHLITVETQHQEDLKQGLGRGELSVALSRKYPNAEWKTATTFAPSRNCLDTAMSARR